MQIKVKGYTPSGSQLCSILLKAYEGAGSNLVQEQWLVGKSLGLLLASSVSAKRAALKGESHFICQMVHIEITELPCL